MRIPSVQVVAASVGLAIFLSACGENAAASAPASSDFQFDRGAIKAEVYDDYCIVTFAGRPDGRKLRFEINQFNQSLAVEITQPGWSIIEGKNTEDLDHEFVLSSAGGPSSTARVGSFSAAPKPGASGLWVGRDGSGSYVELMALLKTASSFKASIDGIDLGSFALGAEPGFLETHLRRCAETVARK